jgi:hypothetical protein
VTTGRSTLTWAEMPGRGILNIKAFVPGHSRHLMPVLVIGSLALAGCTQSNPSRPDDPNMPSPTVGSDTSQRANELADKAMYKPIAYKNIAVRGPNLIVIPGDIKSSNASFTQKFGSNNIADFAELEFGRANFGVLERSDLGPLLQEFQLAYTIGDPDAARKILQRGKLKTTRWVVKLDILKAEQVAAAKEGFDGRAVGQLIDIFGRNDKRSQSTGTLVGSIKTEEGTSVWIIGMRYKVLDAVSTEQVATGYAEQKMEVGAKSTSVMGFSQGSQGGLTLDGMVQRLVQQLVFEIDRQHKGAQSTTSAGRPPPAARAVSATVAHDDEHAQAMPEPLVNELAPELAPQVSDSVPATPASSRSPSPLVAQPATEALADSLESKQLPLASPATPPPAPSAEVALVSPTRSPLATREIERSQPALATASRQDQTIKVGAMTASGRFTVDAGTGTLSGTGTVTWTDGNRYEGPMVAGKKQGQGVFVWPNGQRYEGDWANDQMTGKGILLFADGSRYEGTVVAGKRQGSGRFDWPNGQRFEGDWSDDAINGRGVLQYANGDRYEGPFKDGEPHGTGRYTLKNGDQYNGEWLAGRKHGQGRLTWTSGDYWEGEFRDDHQTDNGKLVANKPMAAEAKP